MQFTKLNVGLFIFNFALSSCVSRETSQIKKMNLAQLSPRKCNAISPTASSGDSVTYTFHWTNDEQAATNPQEYIKTTMEMALKANQETIADIDLGVDSTKAHFRKEGNMYGHGLYLATDLFQSMRFGKTVVVVPIHKNLEFGIGEPGQVNAEKLFRANCPGTVYLYDRSIFGQQALALYDLQSIDLSKVRSFTPASLQAMEVFSYSFADPVDIYSVAKDALAVKHIMSFAFSGYNRAKGTRSEFLKAISTGDSYYKKNPEGYKKFFRSFEIMNTLRHIDDWVL